MPIKQNDLAIIIPVLNDVEILEQNLPFILRFILPQNVYVIEANQSEMRSKEVCQKYKVQYFCSDTTSRAAQMNLGAQRTFEKNIVFLHADVRPPENFVSLILDSLNKGVQMGFFAYQFSPSNRWLDINARFTTKDGLFAGGGDQIHFMTRDTFELLNGYDESFVIMEDFDFFRRAKKKQIPYHIIQQPATVSSRKYADNSYLWVNFVNFCMFIAFLLGVKPQKLKRVYKKALS